MNIELRDIGKQFGRRWVFRHLDFRIEHGASVAILGPNGSGKSTLLQVLSGVQIPSEGDLNYSLNGSSVSVEEIYTYLSIVAPYTDVMEQFTLPQLLKIHGSFKPLIEGKNTFERFQKSLEIELPKESAVRHYSSGMKQRIKLGLAIWSTSPLVLLDEPLANLDSDGRNWYRKLLENRPKDQQVIVCSNHDSEEHFFCTQSLQITDFSHPINK